MRSTTNGGKTLLLSILVFITPFGIASAQVVDLAPGGGEPYYANFAADGVANASSPAAQSWNNYRKGSAGNAPPLPTVADNGDGSVTYSGLSHGGNAAQPDCCGNPGMFFGQSPSTSSYDGAQLFVGNNTEVGNAMDDDSAGRRRFDMRFGFTESTDDWIAGKTSNSGDFDMWTNDHGSDTIYLNFQIGGTDAAGNGLVAAPSAVAGDPSAGNLINENNRYANLSSALKGQSATAGTGDFRGEQDRNRWIAFEGNNIRQTEGLFSPFEPTVVDHTQPDLNILIDGTGGGLARMDTGIELDGNVPIKWWMEANDPMNADPVLARQVLFHIQAGNVQYSQLFDPGGSDLSTTADDMVPNPSFDGGLSAFEDGFFDWQNATPLFFIGPSGGADVTGSMEFGFTNEGGSSLLCDFDTDGDCDQSDINTLFGGDGRLGPSAAEINDWLSQASNSANTALGSPTDVLVVGDANLDGGVDSTDLGLLLNNFGGNTNTWLSGDLDASGGVNSGDLGLLLNNFGHMSPASANAVPEPNAMALIGLGMLSLLAIRRRR